MIRFKDIIPQKIKNFYHLGQAILANFIFGFPSRYLTVIGVTGTNGKTTTVQMITRILEAEYGVNKVAMVSTINFKLGDITWVNATKFTTLSSWKVQSFLKKAAKIGCKFVVLEVSSHSLDQNRLWGIKFDTAAITNVTREHLDYHSDMEKYRLCKLKLFADTKTAVVNLDMEFPQDYLDYGANKSYAFSIKYDVESIMYKKLKDKCKNLELVSAKNIKSEINNSSYMIHNTLYMLHLSGLFNVENALAATCVGIAYKIDSKKIASALEKIKGIPGRLERIENGRGLNVIVDYAVTPDSLEKLYFLIDAMRKSKNYPEQSEGSRDSSCLADGRPAVPQNDNGSKIIAVFGACGERDRGKRPIMGEIVAKFADYIVLTNEDPYNEDPNQIINEVMKGIPFRHPERSEGSQNLTTRSFADAQDDIFRFTENVNLWRVMDRRAAIKKALQIAKPGDYIIVTGKGAEVTMAIGKKRISWNDKKVILEELKN